MRALRASAIRSSAASTVSRQRESTRVRTQKGPDYSGEAGGAGRASMPRTNCSIASAGSVPPATNSLVSSPTTSFKSVISRRRVSSASSCVRSVVCWELNRARKRTTSFSTSSMSSCCPTLPSKSILTQLIEALHEVRVISPSTVRFCERHGSVAAAPNRIARSASDQCPLKPQIQAVRSTPPAADTRGAPEGDACPGSWRPSSRCRDRGAGTRHDSAQSRHRCRQALPPVPP